MNCGHLFNGIGGFALAAHWMGWENVMHCEIDPFCNKVMNHHFPKSFQHEDIRTTDFTIWRGRIDLLTGGFPCQPYSTAGKRQGTADNRHLWPEMLRAIREIQPTWIVPENVRGLINWSKGMVFEQVQAEMEIEGYEVVPLLLPAAGVNAPHERYRVWFVAYRAGEFCGKKRGTTEAYNSKRQGSEHVKEGYKVRNISASVGECGDVAYADSQHLQGFGASGINAKEGRENEERQPCKPAGHDWSIWPTQPPVCGKYDGLSDWMVRRIKPEIYASISERYTDKDLQEVWEAFQSPEIRGSIGRLYKIHESDLLLKTVQLCSPSNTDQKGTSVCSQEASEGILRKMRDYGKLADSPQGRELEKQFTEQFGNTLPKLSHEVALVYMEVEKACITAFSKWRNESLKALGNAIVPQVVYQIFKAIDQYNNL